MNKLLFSLFLLFLTTLGFSQNFVPLDSLRKLPKYIIEDNLPIRLYSYPYSTKIVDVECDKLNRDSIYFEYHIGDTIQPVNRFEVRRLIVSQHPLKGSTIDFSEYPNLQELIYKSYGCDLSMKDIKGVSTRLMMKMKLKD